MASFIIKTKQVDINLYIRLVVFDRREWEGVPVTLFSFFSTLENRETLETCYLPGCNHVLLAQQLPFMNFPIFNLVLILMSFLTQGKHLWSLLRDWWTHTVIRDRCLREQWSHL